MNTIDCKCGNCQSVFPLNLAAYKKRFKGVGEGHAYTENDIQCPSCLAKMPHALVKRIVLFVESSNFEECKDWAISSNFLPK